MSKKKFDSKKEVKKIMTKLLSQSGAMNDLAIYTKIIMSLKPKEMSAMWRYHEIISFISAIKVYEDLLVILYKDKSKFSQNTFTKILRIRNKIAREHRFKQQKNEELFKKILIEKFSKRRKSKNVNKRKSK